MIRRLIAFAAAAAANAPWILVWLRAERDPLGLDAAVSALFILLTIGIAAAVILPCVVVPGLASRRWLLLGLLAMVNTFWPLRWIDMHAGGGRGFPGADAPVRAYLALMVLSSALAAALYAMAGRAVGFARRQR